MRHDLIGYLLGALDGCEHETIRQQLDSDVELRRQLLNLERRLSVLERQRVQFEPPMHLCDATCQLIANHAGSTAVPHGFPSSMAAGEMAAGEMLAGNFALPGAETPVAMAGRARAALSPTRDQVGRPRQWSLADMVTAAGIFLAAAFLFFPTVVQSQYDAMMIGCQDHQRQLGESMISYAGIHRTLPSPPREDGPLGKMAYVPSTLVDEHFITADQLNCLVCPAAAQKRRHVVVTMTFPGRRQLALADAMQIAKIAALLDSSYCFPLGYAKDGEYVPRTPGSSSYMPLIADRPDAHGAVDSATRINCLFEDLSIRSLFTGAVENPESSYVDDIYVNDEGEAGPGLHPKDAVLLRGTQRPNYSRVRFGFRLQRTNPANPSAADILIESQPQ